MAIRALSIEEFNRVAAAHSTVADLSHTAVEWFVTDEDDVLGVIGRHQSDQNWSCVVFGRDNHAVFHVLYLECGVSNVDDARRRLFAHMPSAIDTGDGTLTEPPLHHVEAETHRR